MKGLEFKVLCLGLIMIMLFSSGCASTQKMKRIEDLEKQVAGLTQAIGERDEQLLRANSLLSDRDTLLQRIEELESQLNNCRKQLKSSEEVGSLK